MAAPIEVAGLGAAWLMGLVGSPHCVGMCGGIATALMPPLEPDVPRGGRAVVLPILLGVGRIGCYGALGALAGFSGRAAASPIGGAAGPALRIGLGLLLVLVGLSIAGIWPRALGWLEDAAGHVWRRLARLSGPLLPVDRPMRALAAGALWGLLPCGLVYAALAGAAVSGSALSGALWMAAFGSGTLPAVLGTGWLAGGAQAWAVKQGIRRTAGALLVLSGVWTLVAPISMYMNAAPGGGHHSHQATPIDGLPE